MNRQFVRFHNMLSSIIIGCSLVLCGFLNADTTEFDRNKVTLFGTTHIKSDRNKGISVIQSLPQLSVDLYYTTGIINEGIGPAGIEVTRGGDIWFLEASPIWPPDTTYSRLVHFYTQFPPDSSFVIVPIESYVAPDYDTAAYFDMYYAPPQYHDVTPTTNMVPGDSSEAYVRFRIPSDSCWCCDLDPNGTIYFTERQADKIGSFDPAISEFTEWLLPTSSSWPIAICAHNDTVFFVECAAAKLGRLIPSTNQITEWDIPNAALFGPGWPGLDIDENGYIWLTDRIDHHIIRAELADADTAIFHKWLLPGTIYVGPNDIMVTQGNEIWYIVGAANPGFAISKIGVFDPITAVIKEWEVPTDTALAYYLEADTCGNLWFGENYGCGIAKLEPAGNTITEYLVEIPAGTDGTCYDFAIDHNGNAWLTSTVGVLYKFPGLVYNIGEQTNRRCPYKSLSVFPNPFVSTVTIMTDCISSLHVYDVTGRHITEVSGRTWNGRDANGNIVNAGIYVLTAKGYKPTKVVKLR